MAHHLYPVGRSAQGRRAGTGRAGAGELVLREGEHGEAPPAPDGLDPRVYELYSELWRVPESVLWRPEDAHLPLRLAILREKIERDGYTAGAFNGATSIEDRLYLSPRSRAARRIRVEPA